MSSPASELALFAASSLLAYYYLKRSTLASKAEFQSESPGSQADTSCDAQIAKVFDVIVVGLGGHGSAAVYSLSKQISSKKLSVLGLEKYENGSHANGSSHGRSRIIRQAYFEDPRYVPLLKRSFQLWRSLQKEYDDLEKNDERLLTMTGGLMIGLPDSTVITGVIKAAKEHNLESEMLNAEEIKRRFPMFNPSPQEIGIFEDEAGFLVPELCVDAFQKIAIKNGAKLRFNESVVHYELTTKGSTVLYTDKGNVFEAKKVIFSVGPWAKDLVVPQPSSPSSPAIQNVMPLKVERRVMYWFEPKENVGGTSSIKLFQNCPVYIWETGQMFNFYGFPHQAGSGPGPAGVKVALHNMKLASTETSSESIDRRVSDSEIQFMRSVIKDRMPMLNGKLVSTATCMYTTTPDEHFLIDYLPHSLNNAVIASPCSGHGFKFCSVVGEILSDMVTRGGPVNNDISLFRLDRFVDGAVGTATTPLKKSRRPRRLLIEGGGDMPADAGKRFFEWATDNDTHRREILVIPWASELPGQECLENFRKWGSNLFNDTNTCTLTLAPSRKELVSDNSLVYNATLARFRKQLDSATAVFFTGGDQVCICAVLDAFDLRKVFHEKYNNGVPFAGTSAGAAMMSEVMITGEGNFDVIEPGSCETKVGMGFVTNAVIDQHFVMRRRENRLISVMMYNQEARAVPYALGIDEEVALCLVDGREGEVLGHANGKVLLLERARGDEGGFALRVLSAGQKFLLPRDKV